MKKHLLAPIAIAAAAAATGMVSQAQAAISVNGTATLTGYAGNLIGNTSQTPVMPTQATAADGVMYDNLDRFVEGDGANAWTTVLTGNTYVLTGSNNASVGLTGQTAKNTSISSAMWADDIYPDPTVYGGSVTAITIAISDDASHTFATSGAGAMGLQLSIYADNGTGIAPGVLTETITADLALQASDDGFEEYWTIGLSPAAITGQLASLPSLFWIGMSWLSGASTTGKSGTKTASSYYVNSMGFGLFKSPLFGSSSQYVFATSTYGNPVSNPGGYDGVQFYAPGTPGTNIDNTNYPSNLGIELDGGTVTPEPSTLAVLGIGGLAAALRRRRRDA